MVDDAAFELDEAEQALRQLGTLTLNDRDWQTVAPALDALTAAVTAGDARAIQRATGRLAVLLAVREPRRIRPAATAEGPPADDVLYRVNELVDVIVVKRREAAGAERGDTEGRRDA